MVSPELEAEYARRKIGAIAPSEGVEALMRELAWGSRRDAQIIYACGDSESLEGDVHLGAPERLSVGRLTIVGAAR
jgi:hypothetical protein